MSEKLVELTAEIVAAYLEGNTVAVDKIPDLIHTVYAALQTPTGAAAAPEETVVAKATAAQIKKSITDKGLVSFEDGKLYQSLKRSLTKHGLTPADYRAKWGLPSDYPMVSPTYAARRSELAKLIGLGSQGRTAKAAKA